MMNYRKAITVAAMAVWMAAPLAGQKPGAAQTALKAAIDKEMVDGDLKGAIVLYEKAVAEAKGDRATAAKALIRMAECHHKLGDAEARRIYERVLREYADQQEAAKTARERLGPKASVQSAKGDRVVWTGREMYSDGRVSADGRCISYTDWYDTGNLMVYDSVTNQHRALTANKDWTTGNAYTSVFSRDGKQLAYGWRGYEPRINELRMIDVHGTATPRTIFTNENVQQVLPTDWSSDGKWLAVVVKGKDGSNQIGIVGVQDGSYRGLRSVGWRGPEKIFFSKDSKYLAYDLPAGDDVLQRDVFILAVNGSHETRAVEHSAHDIVMGWSADGAHLLFASDRMGAMGLWAAPVTEGKTTGVPILLKPNIGAASTLGLTAAGALHVIKDASTSRLQTLRLDLANRKILGPPVVENYVLPTRPDWTRDGASIAYPSVGSNGVRSIIVRSLETGQARELRPALHYFNEVRWTPDGKSFIAFARDLRGKSGIYRIDAQTGTTSFITPSEITRPHVSPDGKKIYYNVNFHGGKGGPKQVVERDLASGEVRDLYVVPQGSGLGSQELSPDGSHLAGVLATMSDKSSALVLIPTARGPASVVARATGPDSFYGSGFLTWTPDSRALLVMKEIKDRTELWLVPVTGGTPRIVDVGDNVLPTKGGPGMRLHPNGTQLAFSSGDSAREVWTLENFLPALSAKHK
ncbi:MAG: PD40 domain-containing protein [Acidobacteria bacterium]|nr:PD40 domain-containing protein [Acidobacteriota bacterium]